MKLHARLLVGGLCSVALFAIGSCGSSGNSYNIPAITPIVKAATPSGLGGTAATGVVTHHRTANRVPTLDTTDLRSRFFGGDAGAGPTQVFKLLPQVDSRIAELNGASTTCLDGTPVAYTIKPAGYTSPITMYAQCYRTVGGEGGAGGFTNGAGVTDPQLFLIGRDTSGVIYVYVAIGAEWLAATETPLATGSSQYAVHLWMGVGYGNGATGSSDGQCGASWSACSYGVAELFASATISGGAVTNVSNFEFTAAGTGLGYCGIQMISDGTSIYAVGSIDMGSSCNTGTQICFPATSTSVAGDTNYSPTCPAGATCTNSCTAQPTCSTADAAANHCLTANVRGFGLTPIGRIANPSAPTGALGASDFPGTAGHLYSGSPANQVTIDGTATDSLYFATGITADWASSHGVTKF